LNILLARFEIMCYSSNNISMNWIFKC